MKKNNKPTWKIYYKEFDPNTHKCIGHGVYHKEYVQRGWAERVAKQRYRNGKYLRFEYTIATENPWFKRCAFCGSVYQDVGKYGGNFVHISAPLYDDNKRSSLHIPNICTKCARELAKYIGDITVKSSEQKEG